MFTSYIVLKDKLEVVDSFDTVDECKAMLLKYWNEEPNWDQVFLIRVTETGSTAMILKRAHYDSEVALEFTDEGIRAWKCTYIMANGEYSTTRVVEQGI